MSEEIVVLVVEDEVLIREIVVVALQDAGFMIEDAHNGEAAIALIDRPGNPIRALVTDINLTSNGATGWDVATRAREMSDAIPVVYMSGESGHEWSAHGVPNSIMIAKPFVPAQIVTAVTQLLNAAPPPVE